MPSLHGNLYEEVYMISPEGYLKLFDNNVCKLKKLLCGLKKALKQWNEKLKASLVEFGFVQNLHDYSWFTFSYYNVFLILLVYVDNIIVCY